MSAAHRTPAVRYLALAFSAAALVLPAVMAFAGAFTGIASLSLEAAHAVRRRHRGGDLGATALRRCLRARTVR